MTSLRVGLIGAGDVAERDYLPEWKRLGDRAELVWVCSRRPERARRVAESYGISKWSTDYADLLDDRVDVVVNLTPIGRHFQITLDALSAGKHVYSEKPLALSSSDARALDQLARQKDLVLVCAPSSLLFPQVLKADEIVRSGRLGRVIAARAQALAGPPPWPGYGSDPSPYFEHLAGPLVDVGVYALHVITGLLGAASSVAALSERTRDEFVVRDGPFAGKTIPVTSDDAWQVLVRAGDCLASIEANFATVDSAAADCELRGELGAVAFSLFDVSRPISLLEPGSDDWVELPVAHERAAGPDHLLGVQHLLDCVEQRTQPLLNAAHAAHVLQIIEAAREAASSGRTIVVAPSEIPFYDRVGHAGSQP
jgi:predicted dehydrogenase